MDPSIQTRDDHAQQKMRAAAPEEGPMETVGVYLKRERESRNLSLGEVARLTKISELYLDCIEKDDYTKVPKGPYAKGYILSYARMIIGDTEKALSLYDSMNQKISPADETLPVMPPSRGWTVALADKIATMIDRLRQIKPYPKASPPLTGNGPQPQPGPSLLITRKTPIETARPVQPQNAPSAKAPEKGESSVLIPFKKYAPPLPDREPVETEPDPAPGTPKIALAAIFLSMRQRLTGFLDTARPWLTTYIQSIAGKRRMIPSPSLLVTAATLLVAVMILVFCGIGVYHVFFYDRAASTTIDSRGDAGLDSAGLLTPSPLPVPHKTARFKKPDAPLPALTLSAPPAAPAPAPQAVAKTAPPRPAAERVKSQTSPAAAAAKQPLPSVVPAPSAAPPAELNVKVLKATICSEIRNRMPADTTSSFPLSVDRVFVWCLIQADKYPTTIHHIFYHEGQVVNRVELNIRSPFWRTWSFKSIDKDAYRGHWRVDITSPDEKVLRRLYFEIN